MEFERAIYRVYERCVEGFRDDASDIGSKSCRLFEYLTLGGAVSFLLALMVLHGSYVNEPGCLPQALAQYPGYRADGTFSLAPDEMIGINLSPTFAPIVLTDDDDFFDPDGENTGGRRGTSVEEGSWRRLMTNFGVMAGYEWAGKGAASGMEDRWALRAPALFGLGLDTDIDAGSSGESDSEGASGTGGSDANADAGAEAGDADASTKGAPVSGLAFRAANNATYDYLFSQSRTLVFMDSKMRASHGFTVYNVTLEDFCFGSGLAPSLLPLGGVDIAVQNMLMQTVRTNGLLKTRLNDYYAWSDFDIVQYRDLTEWLIFKTSVLLMSLFSFFALSSTTALLVRILISSGVVLIFPLFWLFGVPIFNNRIISLSYPWLGVPIEMLRANNQSPYPFIMGHCAKIVLYYTLYEAAQFTFSLWFYGSPYPGQKELWLYAIIMFWEYYSMIYVRTKMSIALFPRASLALFLIYHFYLYSCPGGFHSLALLVMFLFLAWLMAATVRKYEVPGFARGDISIEAPRALINMVPWPTWQQALPPDESLFQPVQRRLESVYNSTPAPRPGTLDAGVGAGLAGSDGDGDVVSLGDDDEGADHMGDLGLSPPAPERRIPSAGMGSRTAGEGGMLSGWTTGLVGRRGAPYSRVDVDGDVEMGDSPGSR